MAINNIGQVGEIVTGDRNKIQIDVQSYDGAVRVAVRQWFTTEEDPEKWIPTKKGFILNPLQAAMLGNLLLGINREWVGSEYAQAVEAILAKGQKVEAPF